MSCCVPPCPASLFGGIRYSEMIGSTLYIDIVDGVDERSGIHRFMKWFTNKIMLSKIGSRGHFTEYNCFSPLKFTSGGYNGRVVSNESSMVDIIIQ